MRTLVAIALLAAAAAAPAPALAAAGTDDAPAGGAPAADAAETGYAAAPPALRYQPPGHLVLVTMSAADLDDAVATLTRQLATCEDQADGLEAAYAAAPDEFAMHPGWVDHFQDCATRLRVGLRGVDGELERRLMPADGDEAIPEAERRALVAVAARADALGPRVDALVSFVARDMRAMVFRRRDPMLNLEGVPGHEGAGGPEPR